MGNRNDERKADTPRELDRDFTGNAVNARSDALKQSLHDRAAQLDGELGDDRRDRDADRR